MKREKLEHLTPADRVFIVSELDARHAAVKSLLEQMGEGERAYDVEFELRTRDLLTFTRWLAPEDAVDLLEGVGELIDEARVGL
ncbi:hypothetical protein VSS37_03875 [Candidatus Thiothrix sp. Deng01]|uniref:Uncharacterized protein n=1 Tax=Candidatus Thiothrix phosphatis TaxID=3112415 RepID=A0ABU6CTF3_9GAMM|nr:hypothetical protein [Candidatus Thiothrix sp. Deng01]MEB4590110.1 hypothetical protein [Candidatus Thiothrix sp. Deng01]